MKTLVIAALLAVSSMAHASVTAMGHDTSRLKAVTDALSKTYPNYRLYQVNFAPGRAISVSIGETRETSTTKTFIVTPKINCGFSNCGHEASETP